jgi:hypothetical protein
MARETIFVVESWTDQNGELVADPPVQCTSGSFALALAHQMTNARAGVVAFQRTGDMALGEYEPAVILVQLGRVPDPLE